MFTLFPETKQLQEQAMNDIWIVVIIATVVLALIEWIFAVVRVRLVDTKMYQVFNEINTNLQAQIDDMKRELEEVKRKLEQ